MLRGDLFRKGLVFGVIVLLGASIVPSISGDTKNSGNDEIVIPYKIQYTVEFSEDILSFDRFMGYDIVKLQDGDFLNVVGKPMLPVEYIQVALPHGMAVRRILVVNIHSVELKGEYSIFPAQPPRRLNGLNDDIPFVEPDNKIYNSMNPFPSRLTEFVHQTDLAGQSMAVIQLYPVQYVPREKKLTLYTTITFLIEGVDGYECGDYLPKRISKSGRNTYEQMIRDMVVNPEDVELRFSDGSNQIMGVEPGDYDYVIITQNSWIDDFQPLAEWKTKKGVKANIVTLDWIYSQPDYSGSNQDKIQDFVEDAYSTWGAMYFLLGGDTNVVPHQTKYYHLYFSGGWEDIYAPSDSYYGDYDQDFTCEVHVGRACVRTTSQISTFINKILTYEQSPPLTDYAKKAALFGFDLDDYTDGEDCKIYIDNTYIPSNWAMGNVYDSDSGNHETNVKNAINDGQNLINHCDHASVYWMGTGSWNHGWGLATWEVDAFYNGDKQSILYSMGCDNAAFDYSNCIAEHFVRDTDGGCIAFIGNSRPGIFVSGSTSMYSFRYDREFFESLFQEGHYVLGECFSDHKNEGPKTDDYYKCIFDELNLLGEPELNIWTEDPDSFDATHPSTLPTGSSSFTVHVEEVGGGDVQNAYVCLWKDNEIYLRNYTGYNGNVTFNPSPSTGGTLYVTVTKHNYLPYEGSAQVSYQPELSYYPTSHDFGTVEEGEMYSTTFDIWDFGTGTLTWFLSDNYDWLTYSPTSGSSTGEHDTIIVQVNTTGLEGSYTGSVDISSNGGNGTFTVTFYVPSMTFNYTFLLYGGWNLITIPVENNFTAKTLMENISGCQIVCCWDSIDQEYECFTIHSPSGYDFPIENGMGYFIGVTEDSNFSVTGKPISNVSINLYEGWNLIGWFNENSTTAMSLLENITSCEIVCRWDSIVQEYDCFTSGSPPEYSFPIEIGMGLFVGVEEESIWNG